jgi:diacylglycerol kinase
MVSSISSFDYQLYTGILEDCSIRLVHIIFGGWGDVSSCSAKLIWSSASETINPESVNEAIESLCKVVMKSLSSHKLIK